MSAFMVSDEHINRIVTYATRVLAATTEAGGVGLYYHGKQLPVTLDDPQKLGELLYAENARSVGAQHYYRTDVATDQAQMWTYEQGHPVPTVAFLKLCACLEYQSCEGEDYYETLAWKVLAALMFKAIRHLDGYPEAEWSV